VFGTAVPKTSVDEHGYALTWKDHVGDPRQMGKGPPMKAEAQSTTVEHLAERDFDRRVA
jgi:hypothetical protein